MQDQDKAQLRKTMRAQRLALTSAEQDAAARHLTERLQGASLFQNSSKLAGYLAHQGEMNPAPLVDIALAAGKQCYLPVLATDPQQGLAFAHYTKDTQLAPNRYGIPEPPNTPGNRLASDQLDMVLVPLVAFDKKGHRLGMGKGYYDRAFAFRQSTKRPLLVGLAYEFQQVDQLEQEAWDVPLDIVITEKALYNFSTD